MNRKFFISLLLLGGVLVSCQDDILLPEEEEPTTIINNMDALRSVKPKSTSGRQSDTIHNGEKGRDHRDWYDIFENTCIKDFEKDVPQLGIGDLYAIDPDGVNPYIFKFYFPEDYRDYANEEYERMYVLVSLYSWWGQMIEYNYFSTNFSRNALSLNVSFTVPREYVSDWYYFVCHFGYYSGTYWHDVRTVKFEDLVIIKEWQKNNED